MRGYLPPELLKVLGLVTRSTPDPYRQLYWYAGYRVGLSRDQCEALMQPGPLPPRFRYRRFTVPKPDGGQREILEPGVDLKAAQRQILRRYLNRARVHPAALGFREGRSIADHAWAHAGAAVIITADIEDFFPSTTADRVFLYWKEHFPYYITGADLFTRLTTHHGGLPQGAPTSPALSNALNYAMDAALTGLARDGTYTRYADDLAFSWPDGGRPPADFYLQVRATLRQYGYRMNKHKGWHQWHRRDEPKLTGVVLTAEGGVDVPRAMRRMMDDLRRTATTPAQKQRLAGYENYRRMVTTRP